ncbi:MAG: protein translocase subunit SecD [Proteobacteria bacterium]|nr:protein translocase subunit SecD [Pseudomonadota bacterium]
MNRQLLIKAALVALVTVVALVYLGPTLMGHKYKFGKGTLQEIPELRLGLDLQGGVLFLLSVRVDEAISQQLDDVKYDLTGKLRGKVGIMPIEYAVTRDPKTGQVSSGELVIRVIDRRDAGRVKTAVTTPDLRLVSDTPWGQRGRRLVYAYDTKRIEQITRRTVRQSMMTIRNRIDRFGVAEPDITRHGRTRILIQLPGYTEKDEAKRKIQQVAKLEFRLVNETATRACAAVRNACTTGGPRCEEAKKLCDLAMRVGGKPDGEINTAAYKYSKTASLHGEKGVWLYTKVLMTGKDIDKANVAYDDRNRPYVSLNFNSRGASDFERITRAHEKKRMAVVLDGKVYSAPTIQEVISQGRAQITGSFSTEEARDLADALQSGSLPVSVEIIQDRAVGPSLGAASVRAGKISIVVGGIIVLLFMVLFYRLSGLVADLALVLNIVFVLAVLAGLGAALTLPGIAGIVLTIGMAVDANVLVFERVREELRAGRPPRAAIDTGYSRATLTILDANATTLIVAVVLWQFGTGPIQGFATTLTIGVLSSMFTAIFITRIIFDMVLGRWQPQKLSI